MSDSKDVTSTERKAGKKAPTWPRVLPAAKRPTSVTLAQIKKAVRDHIREQSRAK